MLFVTSLTRGTSQYPDIVLLVQGIFRSRPEVQSFIIDAEIAAINPVDGSIKTFQELSNRARKDVKVDEIKVPVCVFAFDLMCLDGEVRIFCILSSILRQTSQSDSAREVIQTKTGTSARALPSLAP